MTVMLGLVDVWRVRTAGGTTADGVRDPVAQSSLHESLLRASVEPWHDGEAS